MLDSHLLFLDSFLKDNLRVSVIMSLYLILASTPDLTLMTFTPQIRVRGRDGSLLKNKAVFLVIYGIIGTFDHTLITDNDGLAPFKLDTVNWNGTDISLEVSTGDDQLSNKEGFCKGKLQKINFFLPSAPICNSISLTLQFCCRIGKIFS